MMKSFVLHEEVIDVFHKKCYITTIEKLSLYLAHVQILRSTECGKARNNYYQENPGKNNSKLMKYYVEKFR